MIARLALFVLLLMPVALAAAEPVYHAQPLAIQTAAGRHELRVELAIDGEAQRVGLMNRASLPRDAGMLFVYRPPRPIAMWMKDTLIPLDMIFIAPDLRVLRVHAGAKPHDLTAIPAGGGVLAVLEINGGLAARLGIRAGDRVSHPALKAP